MGSGWVNGVAALTACFLCWITTLCADNPQILFCGSVAISRPVMDNLLGWKVSKFCLWELTTPFVLVSSCLMASHIGNPQKRKSNCAPMSQNLQYISWSPRYWYVWGIFSEIWTWSASCLGVSEFLYPWTEYEASILVTLEESLRAMGRPKGSPLNW